MFVYRTNTYHPCMPDARVVLPPRVLAGIVREHPELDPTAPCWAIPIPSATPLSPLWAVQFQSLLASPVRLHWLDHLEVTKCN